MCDTYTWRKASHTHKEQTHRLVREGYIRTMTARVQLKKEMFLEARRQDKLIGSKPSVIK
jgi:hypothetical protein